MKNILEKYIKKKKIILGLLTVVFLIVLCMFASVNSSEKLQSQMVTMPLESNSLLEEMEVVSLAEKAQNQARFAALEKELNIFLGGQSGTWSVYVKNLTTDDTISINNQPMYAASLTKLFVMEHAFLKMDLLKANGYSEETIMSTLNAMITVSDNDAYNNLVSMHSASGSFTDGCLIINEYLSGEVYKNTGIYHTLHPCKSPWLRTSITRNQTSVEDCGLILEAIYDGTCVSEEASEQMLKLLLNQERTGKIPAGLPEGIRTANKTGETDYVQHDAAIVFGAETDYILCVMSSNAAGAIYIIQDISGLVYEYLQ